MCRSCKSSSSHPHARAQPSIAPRAQLTSLFFSFWGRCPRGALNEKNCRRQIDCLPCGSFDRIEAVASSSWTVRHIACVCVCVSAHYWRRSFIIISDRNTSNSFIVYLCTTHTLRRCILLLIYACAAVQNKIEFN